MRFAVLAAFVFIVFLGVHAGSGLYGAVAERAGLATAFTNDSVRVDIIDQGISPDAVPLADSDNTPSSEGSGGSNIDVSNTDSNSSSETNGNTISEVVVTVSTSEGGSTSSSNSSSESNASNTDQSSTQQTVSAEDILNTLTGNQAVTSNSASGSGGGSSGSGSTFVSGEKTRAALLSRGITAFTIPPPPAAGTLAAASRAPYSRADLALIVSGELVKNPDIDSVFYTTNSITVSYKATGRLFFALPIPYTTNLTLSFDAPTTKERVRVTFPWYKFMMWTGVSKSALQEKVDSIITAAPSGQEYDRATLVFQQVSTLLEQIGARTIQ